MNTFHIECAFPNRKRGRRGAAERRNKRVIGKKNGRREIGLGVKVRVRVRARG
jgi:hypothetical protein